MYLLIDNSVDDKVVLQYCLDTNWVQVEFSTEGKSLLELLDGFLKNLNKLVSDIKGIAVVVGKGRFTATRVATTMVNALAYTNSIPVLAVDGWYEELRADLLSAPSGIYISAKYSAPANIGKKK